MLSVSAFFPNELHAVPIKATDELPDAETPFFKQPPNDVHALHPDEEFQLIFWMSRFLIDVE